MGPLFALKPAAINPAMLSITRTYHSVCASSVWGMSPTVNPAEAGI